MVKRLPPLNALKAFDSAARHLSFTKAAEELFVTQAAVSHQIKILEDFLGIELFLRKNRTLELTEAGKIYFFDVHNILKKLMDATEKLTKNKGQSVLSMNIPQTFGMQWLVPQLSEFNRLYPDIDVRINGVDHDEGLLTREVDIAVYYGKGDWKGLTVERLKEARLLILAAPSLLQRQPILQPDDLRQHTLLHVHNRDNWQRALNALQLDGIDLQHNPVFSHTFMALQAAIHGQGIVLANELLAQKEITQGNLQEVLNLQLKDPKSFYVVYHSDRENDQKIKAFRDWLISLI
ncbi:transcriptional regulator GcvA [Gallibacterium salpingitidis]|uniref:Transcriptional regulator n=1 Tax=Gallibacterium salpingitidis TaxID=505341 RepID=A0A1A7NYM5_9PAST|nr:transcriptional regulator GcvA [Gallibacterium salpingitidis]OBW94690.1 transcriptional regulator [Gallibacterium salpingitidis]